MPPQSTSDSAPKQATDEARFRRRRGENFCAFIDHRIPIVADALGPEMRERFLAMSYAQQCALVVKLVEQGRMI